MTDEQKRKCTAALFKMAKNRLNFADPMSLSKMLVKADQIRPLSLPFEEMRTGFIEQYEYLRKNWLARQRIQTRSFTDEIVSSVKTPPSVPANAIGLKILDDMTPNPSIPKPPINAEFILHLLLRNEEQDAVIGDLLEQYTEKYERLGKRRSDLWFCTEVFRSVWPLLRRALGKVGGLVILEEWFRRLTH